MEHDRIWFQQPNMPPDAMMIIEQMVRKQPASPPGLAFSMPPEEADGRSA
jgi:hypothetical protein